MSKKICFYLPAFLTFILLISWAYAIAVIVPAVYAASLSVLALFSNLLISIAAYSAAKGVFGRNAFKEGISSKISLLLEIIGKSTLLFISTAIAIWIVNPLTLKEAALAGIISISIVLAVLWLGNYKKFIIVPYEDRSKLFNQTLKFGVFVFIACTIIAFASIELKEISINDASAGGAEQKKFFDDLLAGALGTVSSANTNAGYSQDLAESAQKNEGIDKSGAAAPSPPDSPQNYVFYPNSQDTCIIKSENHEKEFTPKTNCIIHSGFFRTRAYCPVIVFAAEFKDDLLIEGTGSCSGSYALGGG